MAKSKPASSSKSKKSGKPRKHKAKKKSLKKKLFLFLGAVVLLAVLGIFLLFLMVYGNVFGKLPSEDELRHIQNSEASILLSADNELIGRYFIQNRFLADFEEIPKNLIDALVSTEDSRYFQHQGIDYISIPRVVIKSLILGDHSSGGGSTISQQLIKNLYPRQNHGFLSIPVNKLKENISALKLEEIYSKEEIITLYLNTVSFGENVYGIKAASLRFFSKEPAELKTEEAAVLIGMLKATTTYNPRLHPEKSLQRRNVVLSQMEKYGHISPAEYEKLAATPIKLNYDRHSQSEGLAPYLRFRLQSQLEKICASQRKENGEPYNLYTDGLRIYTTINSKLQELAQEALKSNMKNLQKQFEDHWKNRTPWPNENFLWDLAKETNRYKNLKQAGAGEAEIKKVFTTPVNTVVFSYEGAKKMNISPLDSIAWHQKILQSAFFAIDKNSGAIKAYSGGADFAFFPYDHVHAGRQVGSTFKPIVYATAIEQGMSPCDYLPNEQMVYPEYENWSPGNADDTYGGFYSLTGGLTYSVNTIAAQVIMETGIEPVMDMAHRMGIDSKLPEVPSLALGTANISLYEMVAAYSAFNNNGKAVTPYAITKVENAAGEVIWQYKPIKPEEAMDPYTARVLLHMMEMVVDSGSGQRINTRYRIKTPVAAKTGTTQNNSDGWFIACTPKMVCGAWVGGESPLVRFRSLRLGQGANTALPIVGSFLKSAEQDKQLRSQLGYKFEPLSPEMQAAFYCDLYTDSSWDVFFSNFWGTKNRNKNIQLPGDSSNMESPPKEKEGFFKRLFGGGN